MFNVILINHKTWIICGGRDFVDAEMFNSAMGDLVRLRGMPECIVNGGARGADLMARNWAERHASEVRSVAADWGLHGRKAGPLRNQTMLDKYKPDLVVAFPGGKGTADMMHRSREAGVDVAEIKADGKEEE